MARKVKIELELDDNGMARSLKVDKDAVVKLGDSIDKTSQKSERFGRITAHAFGELAARGISSLISGMGRLARNGFRLLSESIKLAGIQQIAERKLEQALINLGDGAIESADDLKALAAEMQKVSNFGDEEIITAQAMLASFKELGVGGVQVLTTDMIDMAAGIAKTKGETVSLNQVAIAIGKAFTDGSSALKRYGISMSDAEAAQFDALTGMEKVNALSKILKNNFEGMAKATQDPFVQASNAVGDLKEKLGQELRPELEKTAKQFTQFLQDQQTVSFASGVGEALLEAGQRVIDMFQFDIPITLNRYRLLSARMNKDLVEGTGKALQLTLHPIESFKKLLAGEELTNPLQKSIDQYESLAANAHDALVQLVLTRQEQKKMREEESKRPSLIDGDDGDGGGGGGGAAGEAKDLLAILKARQAELIREGQITEELIRLNVQIARIEQERALAAKGSIMQKIEAMDLEKGKEEEMISLIMERKQAEIDAAAETINAAEAARAAKEQLRKQEERYAQQVLENAAAQGMAAGNVADAVRASVKQIISALLAQFIAKMLVSIAGTGPLALALAAPMAAAAGAAFSAAIPGFATGGTVPGTGSSDSMLMRATPGEEVINAQAASRNRPLLKAINAGHSPAMAGGESTVNVRVSGELTADNERIVARINETETTIRGTRGQVRRTRPGQ